MSQRGAGCGFDKVKQMAPGIAKIAADIQNLPQIKQYLEKRPVDVNE